MTSETEDAIAASGPAKIELGPVGPQGGSGPSGGQKSVPPIGGGGGSQNEGASTNQSKSGKIAGPEPSRLALPSETGSVQKIEYQALGGYGDAGYLPDDLMAACEDIAHDALDHGRRIIVLLHLQIPI